MCKRAIWTCLLALLGAGDVAAEQYAFVVNFKDKNNTPFSLATPSTYLSPRALARRTAQGIAVDSTDLPVNKGYVDSIVTLTNAVLHNTSRWLNHCVILISDSADIHNIDGKDFVAGYKLVAYYPGILHLKPTRGTGQGTGNTAAAEKPTAMDATHYGNTWQQTTLVSGQHLHNKGHMGAGKLIAVFDAGFIGTNTHPGLDSMRTAGRMVDSYNFTLANNIIYSYDSHGTRALATMAGYVPGTYVGSAPLASYALYVTEDGNSEQPMELYNMLSATERADSAGADIISNSLGYNTFANFPPGDFVFATDFDGKTTVAAQAANIATKKGILFVTSAGNEGTTSWSKVLTPGDADSAITVGSVNFSGTPAANSGYGPNAAGRIKPDVACLGEPAATFLGSGYGSENGTSFATPQIAGWAACLWQSKPSATPYQIRQAIIKCASKYTAPDDRVGYGIPNFQCTADLLGIISKWASHGENSWIHAMPNPFGDALQLQIAAEDDGDVAMTIVDVTGKTVLTTTASVNKGVNTISISNTAALAKGIYILKAISATRQQTLKLEKL